MKKNTSLDSIIPSGESHLSTWSNDEYSFYTNTK